MSIALHVRLPRVACAHHQHIYCPHSKHMSYLLYLYNLKRHKNDYEQKSHKIKRIDSWSIHQNQSFKQKKPTKQIILTCKRATCKIESYTFLEWGKNKWYLHAEQYFLIIGNVVGLSAKMVTQILIELSDKYGVIHFHKYDRFRL